MINNLGATADSTHFGGSLETMPRGYRRIFTMKRFELPCLAETDDGGFCLPEKGLGLRHPRFVVEHVAYRQRVYRIMGWRHPWIKVARSVEELFLNLRYGNFRFILQSLSRRIGKWMGKEDYR